MRQGKYLGLNLPDYTDAADVQKLVENFEKLEERAPGWTNLSNSGTVLETGGSFQVAPLFPVGMRNFCHYLEDATRLCRGRCGHGGGHRLQPLSGHRPGAQ